MGLRSYIAKGQNAASLSPDEAQQMKMSGTINPNSATYRTHPQAGYQDRPVNEKQRVYTPQRGAQPETGRPQQPTSNSHRPVDRFATDTESIGDSTLNESEIHQPVNNAIDMNGNDETSSGEEDDGDEDEDEDEDDQDDAGPHERVAADVYLQNQSHQQVQGPADGFGANAPSYPSTSSATPDVLEQNSRQQHRSAQPARVSSHLVHSPAHKFFRQADEHANPMSGQSALMDTGIDVPSVGPALRPAQNQSAPRGATSHAAPAEMSRPTGKGLPTAAPLRNGHNQEWPSVPSGDSQVWASKHQSHLPGHGMYDTEHRGIQIAQDRSQSAFAGPQDIVPLARRASQVTEKSADFMPELDYTPEVLAKMDFAQIKAESFDFGPQEARQSDMSLDQPLTDILMSTLPMAKGEQIKLFGSLTIEEWEDAGDWFQDRFAEIMGDLKKVRRDKRRLAREFEDEIEQRHGNVVQKRQMTEDALAFMKDSGCKVLQSTPRKR